MSKRRLLNASWSQALSNLPVLWQQHLHDLLALIGLSLLTAASDRRQLCDLHSLLVIPLM